MSVWTRQHPEWPELQNGLHEGHLPWGRPCDLYSGLLARWSARGNYGAHAFSQELWHAGQGKAEKIKPLHQLHSDSCALGDPVPSTLWKTTSGLSQMKVPQQPQPASLSYFVSTDHCQGQYSRGFECMPGRQGPSDKEWELWPEDLNLREGGTKERPSLLTLEQDPRQLLKFLIIL
jgi:hypothetical protein